VAVDQYGPSTQAVEHLVVLDLSETAAVKLLPVGFEGCFEGGLEGFEGLEKGFEGLEGFEGFE